MKHAQGPYPLPPLNRKAILRVVCIIYYFGLSTFLLCFVPRKNESEPNYSGC